MTLVKFTRGRGNTLGENQRTHNLETFAGFSYEGFRAIDQYVRDISASEAPPQLKKRDPSERAKPDSSLGREAKPRTGAQKVGKQFSKFIPNPGDLLIKQGAASEYSGWINGKIDGVPAEISIEKDIYRFGRNSIDRNGGLKEVVRLLSRKESLPCVVIKGLEEGRYVASLFQTGKTLSEFLSAAPKSQENALVQSREPEPKQKAAISNGTTVAVRLSRVESEAAFGSFEHDGTVCQITISLKGKKMIEAMKKAYNQKKTDDILVTGYSNGLYSGRKR